MLLAVVRNFSFLCEFIECHHQFESIYTASGDAHIADILCRQFQLIVDYIIVMSEKFLTIKGRWNGG